MTLNVRRRNTSGSAAAASSDVPPEIDHAQLEAFADGAENVPKRNTPVVSNPFKSPAAKTTPPEQKVIRDAFTMPAEDHCLFSVIQQRCLSLGIATTKSEILRAALNHLSSLEDKAIIKVIKAVPKIKAGRPATKS